VKVRHGLTQHQPEISYLSPERILSSTTRCIIIREAIQTIQTWTGSTPSG